MIRAFKYRLDPTDSQVIQMEKTFGCCRFVYNWALDLKIQIYQREKRSITAVDLCKQLTLLKKDQDHTWLNEVSNECLQQSIRCLDQAFTKFFREHSGFPKFKSKHRSKNAFKNRWLYITLHQCKIIYIHTEIRTGFHQNPLPSGKVFTSKDSFDFLMILKAPLISALIIAPDSVLNKPRLERLPL